MFSRTRNLGLFSLLALLFLVDAASATPVLQINSSGILTGVSDMVFRGHVYQIEFKKGTCPDLFSGCTERNDFPFHTQGGAIAAAQALIDQVFDPNPIFDMNPWLTQGCAASTTSCVINTPYYYEPAVFGESELFGPGVIGTLWPAGVYTGATVNTHEGCSRFLSCSWDGTFWGYISAPDDPGAPASSWPTATWAVWTKVGDVPEPSPLALLLAGSACLIVLQLRSRREQSWG